MNKDIIIKNITHIFQEINNYINNINEQKINDIILVLFHILILLKNTIINFIKSLNLYNNYKNKYKSQIKEIINDLDLIDNNYLNKIFNFNCDKIIKYQEIYKNKTYNINKNYYNNIIKYNNNLSIDPIDIIMKKNFNLKIITNAQYENIDIGFGNMYQLHTYDNIYDDIPLNLLVYIKKLKQVVIKVGTENNYKFINSKLYKVYTPKNKINNGRSIICNNNIKSKGKKCLNNLECNYYHDPIIGYEDNAHETRQFSNNPIIYNYIDFKDGSKVKEYTKLVEWEDAINLYQSSLSTILIGCIHSQI